MSCCCQSRCMPQLLDNCVRWQQPHLCHSVPLSLDLSLLEKEKRAEIWRSHMTNNPKLHTMHRWNDTKTLQIRSIIQLLRTDLGRSAVATTVIQLVWLTWGLKAQPSQFPSSACNQKDKHLKIYKLTSIKRPREKEGDLTQSYDKTPLYQQKIRKPKDNTHKRHQKLRLHNDCGPT